MDTRPRQTLPFADAAFDAVLSQFGLMFFEDRPAGLREMQRVLRPGGHLAVAVCDDLTRSAGYAALSMPALLVCAGKPLPRSDD